MSRGNPVYEKYYRQVDAGHAGRVLASDAAALLKKSGLPDLVLGKIWDLADTDGKGVLSKQEFFIALRLVACAQNGLEVSLNSLNLAVPPPRFHDPGSPLLTSALSAAELPWSVKPEDKAKYDAIFDSLSPVDGLLSGDKVKPVLLNSKLPVEILGRVWELSDIDHDGKLDRDEFAVAMFLVYCALEKEPVPMSLPPALVPPSKRQTWVVSSAEKAKYDEIFLKTDTDMDGFVSGSEVREIFLKTGLPSALLARIWALCDTKGCGKLSKDQFALAFHLINQKLLKGTDPPHVLPPEMVPPSDRSSSHKSTIGSSPAADFSAIKELDTLNNEIVDLQREKNNVEQDLREKEGAVKQRTSEVQDLQDEVQRETANLQKLQAQKQQVQELLGELDEQKAQLEEQLQEVRKKCAEEAQLARSSPEIPPSDTADDNELGATAASENVCPRFDQDKPSKEDDPFNGESSSLTDPVTDTNLDFFQSDPFVGSDPFKDDPFGKIDPFGGDPFKGSDPFASDCFFKQTSDSDPFATSTTDPFSASSNGSNTLVDALSHNDPFAPGGTAVVAASDSAADPFASVFGNEPFGDGFADFSTLSKANSDDPFNPATSSSASSEVIPKTGFEEMPVMTEDVPPALPPKTGTPTRPCPPPPGQRPSNKLEPSDPFKPNDPRPPFPGHNSPTDPFTSATTNKEADPSKVAHFSAYPSEEDMIEWAKRESEKEEEQRLARLNQQEREDLELAIALSKSEMSSEA
uniref:Epidermal growth factor receptor pathway substrate 15 n=1 Tax=Jaculus jaculus TaxID=51337 RepID=A0A8C5JWY3_JACJA